MKKQIKARHNISLPAGDELRQVVKDYAEEIGKKQTTMFWEALAEKHPKLARAIMEDRM